MLEFEESEGDYSRIVFLYGEMRGHMCAVRGGFRFRYARWMSAQAGKEEETRNIYLPPPSYVPVSRPGIRLQFAYFEEMCGRVEIAQDLHGAVLMKLPDCVEAIISRAYLEAAPRGLDAAIEIYKAQIDNPGAVDFFTKAALVTESALSYGKSRARATRLGPSSKHAVVRRQPPVLAKMA